MKKIFVSFVLLLSVAVEAQDACVTKYYSDLSYLKSALSIAESEVLGTVTLNRVNAMKAIVSIKSKKEQLLESIQVVQTCEGKLSPKAIAIYAESFVCKESVNCMPEISPEELPFCTDDYLEWAKENCEQPPMILG